MTNKKTESGEQKAESRKRRTGSRQRRGKGSKQKQNKSRNTKAETNAKAEAKEKTRRRKRKRRKRKAFRRAQRHPHRPRLHHAVTKPSASGGLHSPMTNYAQRTENGWDEISTVSWGFHRTPQKARLTENAKASQGGGAYRASIGT